MRLLEGMWDGTCHGYESNSQLLLTMRLEIHYSLPLIRPPFCNEKVVFQYLSSGGDNLVAFYISVLFHYLGTSETWHKRGGIWLEGDFCAHSHEEGVKFAKEGI